MNRESEEWVTVAPDGGWGWVVVIASFFVTFFADGIVLTFGIYLQTLSDELDETIGAIALITSISQVFYFFSGPLVGAVVDRFGCRTVGFIGGIFCAIGYGSSSFCKGLPTLMVTMGMLGGIGLGMMYAPANIIVGVYFKKWRAMATGIAACGSSVGVLSMSQVTSKLLTTFGWRRAYLILGGCLLVPSLMSQAYIPLKKYKVVDGERIGVPVGAKAKIKVKCTEIFCPCRLPKQSYVDLSMKITSEDAIHVGAEKSCKNKCLRFVNCVYDALGLYLLKSPAFVLFLVSGTFLFGGYIIPYVYVENRASSNGIDHTIAVWLLSTLGIGNTTGRIVGGVLSSVSRMNMVLYSLICLSIGGTFGIVSGLKIFMVSYFQLIYAFIHGFSISCFCLRPVIVVQLFGLEHLTHGFGLMMLFYGIGCVLTTSFGGFVYDMTGKYDGVFYMGGCCLICSSICLTLLRFTRKWEIKRGILVGEELE